jgi:hypothetical protein
MDMTDKATQTDRPQTSAEIMDKINPLHLQNIAQFGCCAFSLLWALGFEFADNVRAIKTLSDMIEHKAIGKDCTVYWVDAIRYLTGRTAFVEFKTVQNASELKDIKGRIIVRYDHNGYNHWVGVENGEVVYNSLNDSVCVRYGKPTQARIIHLNEE